jgi:hypothetical protein
MKDEREDPKTKRTYASRIEYQHLVREDEPEPGPAPYDVAPPGTPDEKVIKKGEHERPGPTAEQEEYDREDERREDAGSDLSPDDIEPEATD